MDGKAVEYSTKIAIPGSSKKIPLSVFAVDNTAFIGDDDENNGYPKIMDAKDAWKAYNDDKSFKITTKLTKGEKYVKSTDIKKDFDGKLYIQINFDEQYLPKMQDISFDIVLTVTNAQKSNAFCSKDTMTLLGVDSFQDGDEITYNAFFKYGWNKSALWQTDNIFGIYGVPNWSPDYFDLSNPFLKKTLDFNIKANPSTDAKDATKDKAGYIHIKGGNGDIYSFDYNGADAYFEVKLDNQGTVNLSMFTSAVKAVMNKYPEADLRFWDWKANPEFDFTANIELYYDDVDFGKSPYLYKWDGSKLTEVDAEFDDGAAYFKTRNLGCYVLSDIKLEVN